MKFLDQARFILKLEWWQACELRREKPRVCGPDGGDGGDGGSIIVQSDKILIH